MDIYSAQLTTKSLCTHRGERKARLGRCVCVFHFSLECSMKNKSIIFIFVIFFMFHRTKPTTHTQLMLYARCLSVRAVQCVYSTRRREERKTFVYKRIRRHADSSNKTHTSYARIGFWLVRNGVFLSVCFFFGFLPPRLPYVCLGFCFSFLS